MVSAGVGYTKFETGALFLRLPTSKKIKIQYQSATTGIETKRCLL